jgi:hypothetical protein
MAVLGKTNEYLRVSAESMNIGETTLPSHVVGNTSLCFIGSDQVPMCADTDDEEP